MPRFVNFPYPQTVVGPKVSAVLGHPNIYVQATADCFVCVSKDGRGVDGQLVGPANGHFMPGGGSLLMENVDPTHRIGVNTGTIYISAVN